VTGCGAAIADSQTPVASVGGYVSKTELPSSTLGPEANPYFPTQAPPTPIATPRPWTWRQRLDLTCPLAPVVTVEQRYALKLLGAAEYRCFYRVVQYESRWRVAVVNPWSGACGLGQAKPCAKMSGKVPDWQTNPQAQIRWVVWYMRSRYGSCYGAAAHEFGWRDEAGAWTKGHGWY
jgi:hypothetical protein